MSSDSAHKITATLFSDPGCPWGYSANPALRVLEWRYADQIKWELVMIGLAEKAQEYLDRGYNTAKMVSMQVVIRDRFGMPFASAPKPRVTATSEACRVVVAAGIDTPGAEWSVFRELQLAQFTQPEVLLDEPETFSALLKTSERLVDLDTDKLISRINDDDVLARYGEQKKRTRSAKNTAGALQGKTANTDGVERFSAPSVVFVNNAGTRLDAAGFQPVEAYDVLIANLDPTLERRAPAENASEALAAFPQGLTTAEVAAIRVSGNSKVDLLGVERELLELTVAEKVRRVPMGRDALWVLA